MTGVEQFPYLDRNPASAGRDLMPDLPMELRRQSISVSAVGLVDSGASISVLQIQFLLGQFNFFQVFDICFFRTRRVFEIRQAVAAVTP